MVCFHQVLLFKEIYDWLQSNKKLKMHLAHTWKHHLCSLLLVHLSVTVEFVNIFCFNHVLIICTILTYICQNLSVPMLKMLQMLSLNVSQICYVHKENLDALLYQTSTFVQKEIYVVIMWKVYGNCHIY